MSTRMQRILEVYEKILLARAYLHDDTKREEVEKLMNEALKEIKELITSYSSYRRYNGSNRDARGKS